MSTLTQLAKRLGATVQGATVDPVVAGVSSIGRAAPGTLVFAEDQASFAAAVASPAAAVITSPEVGGSSAHGKPLLVVAQPRLVFARAAKLLAEENSLAMLDLEDAALAKQAVHPTAVVAPGARLAANVSVGPYAVIEDQVSIGVGTAIGSGAVIGKAATVGANCHIYPRVVLYPGTVLGDRVVVHAGAVLGGDGFGYVRDRDTGEYLQFPQQGRLVIEDDVEIGANAAIDRGALEETRIARGVKLDNLVHIGHNVAIGRNVVIAAQTGVSGSSIIGDNAIVGGQVGIADHVNIGDGVILGAQAGIPSWKKIRGSGVLFWGTPAQPIKRYLKQLAALARLTRSSGED